MAKLENTGLMSGLRKLQKVLAGSTAGLMTMAFSSEAAASAPIPTAASLQGLTPASSTLLSSDSLRDHLFSSSMAAPIAIKITPSVLDRHLEDKLERARIENFAKVSGLPPTGFGAQMANDDARVTIGSYDISYADYKALQRLIDTNIVAFGMSEDSIPFMLALVAQESSFRGNARASDGKRGNSALGFNQVIRSSGLALAEKYQDELRTALIYNNIDPDSYSIEGLGDLYDSANGHIRRNGRIVGYTAKVAMNEEQKVVMGLLGSLHMMEHSKNYERRNGHAPSALAGYYGHFSGSTANPDRVSGSMSRAAINSNRNMGATRRAVVATANRKLQRISDDILIDSDSSPRQMAGISYAGIQQEQELRGHLADIDATDVSITRNANVATSAMDLTQASATPAFNFLFNNFAATTPATLLPETLLADKEAIVAPSAEPLNAIEAWSRPSSGGYNLRSINVTSSFARAGETGNRVTVRVERDENGNTSYQPIRTVSANAWDLAA